MGEVDLIDFEKKQPQFFLNDRLNKEQKNWFFDLYKKMPCLEDHIWLTTSGTTSKSSYGFKLVALSKRAIFLSAQSVNDFFNLSNQDLWLKVLPSYHMGGLGIYARAFLSGSTVIEQEKWNASLFVDLIERKKITLTSLVPAQVYDLVCQKQKAPNSLKAVFVGGASLNFELYMAALKIGWPLLPSYGMTETSAQIATAPLTTTLIETDHITTIPKLKLLPHVQINIKQKKDNGSGSLIIKSDSLLTGYGLYTSGRAEFVDPKKQGWFETGDFGRLDEKGLTVCGRENDFFKIGGESTSISRLREIFLSLKLKKNDYEFNGEIFLFEDHRLGFIVGLVIFEKSNFCFEKMISFDELPLQVKELVNQFHQKVMPFEKIRKIVITKEEKSILGKNPCLYSATKS